MTFLDKSKIEQATAFLFILWYYKKKITKMIRLCTASTPVFSFQGDKDKVPHLSKVNLYLGKVFDSWQPQMQSAKP